MAVFEHGFVVNFEIRALQNHIINNLIFVITKLENSLSKEVSNLKVENANLQLKIRALEIAQARRAKQNDELQQYLHIEHTESVRADSAEDSDEAAGQDDEVPTIPSSSTKRKGKKRIRIEEKLKGLPVIKETVRIPREVEESPDQWEEFGEVVTEEVLVIPTKLGRHLIRSKKYRNKQDRTSAPIMAKAPIRFCSSYVSASLATYIVLSKYLDHSTLYRLEKKFERMGLEMTRQSQSDAVQRMSEWLRPLYELMDKHAKSSGYLQIDETFIKYINGNKPGVGQGYFWAIHAPGQSIVLKWINNRRHENVETLVEGFEGILQSDGYAAYSNYVEQHPEITLTACWAHTFRKFRDALEHEPAHAKGMMRLISKLYKLEEKWDLGDVSPSKRKLLRQTESIPIAKQIKDKLDAPMFRLWAEDRNAATHGKFYDAQSGQYGSGDQVTYILPLISGVVPDNLYDKVFASFEETLMETNKGHLSTGLAGTYMMIQYLQSIGRDDLIYSFASKKTYPSWGHMIENGATATWEHWEGDRGTRIHNCYNNIGSWFIQGLAGIRPDPENPGFQNAIIQPAFLEELEFVNGSHDSLYGRIESNWKREGDTIIMTLKIPANSSATVYVPAKAASDVTVNGEAVTQADHVTFLKMENNRAVLKVSSGDYTIRSNQVSR